MSQWHRDSPGSALRKDLLLPSDHWAVVEDCNQRVQRRLANSAKSLDGMAACWSFFWHTFVIDSSSRMA